MAIHTKQARKLLTKKEQAHLTKSGINSMETFQMALVMQKDAQRQAEEKHGKDIPFFLCRCSECFDIAHKLGMN
jgi:hypothetical protein